MIRGALGNDYKGAQSALEVTFVVGSASVALLQDHPWPGDRTPP